MGLGLSVYDNTAHTHTPLEQWYTCKSLNDIDGGWNLVNLRRRPGVQRGVGVWRLSVRHDRMASCSALRTRDLGLVQAADQTKGRGGGVFPFISSLAADLLRALPRFFDQFFIFF